MILPEDLSIQVKWQVIMFSGFNMTGKVLTPRKQEFLDYNGTNNFPEGQGTRDLVN
jgi:hypothetical protein